MIYRHLHIVFAFVFAALTAFAGFVLVSAPKEGSKAASVEVPVAAHTLEAMATVTEQDVSWIQVPEGALDGVTFLRERQDIVGQTVIHTLQAGSLFTSADLLDDATVNPFHLPEGYRAVTVENTPIIGLGGHLKTGMFVDIVWIRGDGESTTAQLAFQNIKVLAVGAPGAVQLEPTEAAKTVTLMMTAQDAVAFAFRAQTGTLAFAVRPSPTEPPINVNSLDVSDLLLQ